MKNSLFALITIMFIPCISKAQLTPKYFSDFIKCKRVNSQYGCCKSVSSKPTIGGECDAQLISLHNKIYDSVTNLMTPRAYNKVVIKNFMYTVAGEEKATNSISVDIASPKAKFSTIFDIKKSTKHPNRRTLLIKTDFSGGLNEDGTRSPVYSSNNFNTSLGFNAALLMLGKRNRSDFRIHDNLKKSVHKQIITATPIIENRAQKLMMLHRWVSTIYMEANMFNADSEMWADSIYDSFTYRFTNLYDTATDTTFENFTRIPIQQKYESVKFSELYEYFNEFKDIQIPKKMLEKILKNYNVNFDYSFLEDKIDDIQDSLVDPFWKKSKLRWGSVDFGVKNLMLNQTNTNGDLSTGLPFYDLIFTGSINRLNSNHLHPSNFILIRGYVFAGRSTNIKNLKTAKIDKDLYYDGKIIQLNLAGFGAEIYGNPFEQTGMPGLYVSARFDYSVEFRNPWIISAEIGPMFNLQDKKSNNFAYIIPTFGFLDIAEPGIDIADGFIFNLKFGIPINLKAK